MGKDGWLYGVKAIAAALGVGERTLWRWMTEGQGVPVVRIGGRWRAKVEELAAWKGDAS